jgi:anti-anti-sigma factor
MEIESGKIGNTRILRIKGVMDVNTVHKSEKEFLAYVNSSTSSNIVIDLGGVEYISSAGLRLLVTALKFCQEKDITLKLSNPNDPVKKVLDIVDMNSMFKIYPTLDEALK